MTPWRTSRFEEGRIAEAIASAIPNPLTQNPREVSPKNAQWTIRALQPHFLHEGKPATVGATLRLDSDIAASLIARSLAELVSKDPPRARGPQW
jgi:hypothetical protein